MNIQEKAFIKVICRPIVDFLKTYATAVCAGYPPKAYGDKHKAADFHSTNIPELVGLLPVRPKHLLYVSQAKLFCCYNARVL